MLGRRCLSTAVRMATGAGTTGTGPTMGSAHREHLMRHVNPGKMPPQVNMNMMQASEYLLRVERGKAPQRIPRMGDPARPTSNEHVRT